MQEGGGWKGKDVNFRGKEEALGTSRRNTLRGAAAAEQAISSFYDPSAALVLSPREQSENREGFVGGSERWEAD